MRSIVTTFVIAGTALMIASPAWAGKYEQAINGCKSAISSEVSGDKVSISLGDVKKSGKNLRLDFKVKVTANNERTRMSARCIANRGGEVISLTIA